MFSYLFRLYFLALSFFVCTGISQAKIMTQWVKWPFDAMKAEVICEHLRLLMPFNPNERLRLVRPFTPNERLRLVRPFDPNERLRMA